MEGRSEYPRQEELEELQELLEQVPTVNDTELEKVMKAAALDRERYEELREIYQLKKTVQNPVNRPFPTYPDYRGELLLGRNPDGHPVGISRRQLNEHMLVVGRTGAGKTTFFYNVMDTLYGKDIPFLVFDFKNDYRHVVDDFDLTVINWRDLKFNPLQPPPGVRQERWAEALVDIWGHAMGVFVPSKGYFLRKLRQLYYLYEDEIDAGRYPSLFELRDLVRADEIHPSSPRFDYMERLENRTTMMTGFSGDIFDCSCGHPIEELLDRNVVLELQEPMREVQQFVVEALLTWIFYYRDAMDHRQGLRHAILFDEAKMVFDAQREQDTDVPHPPVTSLMGRVREFGEALVVADHEPSKLSDSLKANTNVKLWMSLGSGKDTTEMADTFGIEDDEVDFTRTLERGEAVLKTAEEEPVPVRLPPYVVDKDVSERDVRERMESVLDLFDAVDRVRPDRFREAIGQFDHGDESGESTDSAEQGDTTGSEERTLGEVAEALLASVNDQPFLSMSKRYDAIDVGAKTGNEAKNELVTLGLVREVEIDSRKPGRNPKLLELTEQGEQVLGERGYEVAATGRRGIRHRYWQQQIKAYYEADGFDVSIEHAVEEGHIDVYAERGELAVAVEVACSPEHEASNVRKCIGAGVNRVEVAYLVDSVRERIASAVRDAFGEVPDRVVFVDVAEFA